MSLPDITPETLADFSVTEDGRDLFHIGLVVTLYVEEAHRPDGKEGLIRCFDDYWARCGDQLHWASVPTLSKKWIDLDSQELPPLGLCVTALHENMPWSVSCLGAQRRVDAAPLNIEIMCRGAWEKKLSYITASLPFVWFSDHQGSLPELVQQWSKWISPYHGYAGLGIIPSLDGAAAKKAEPAIYTVARRFPGLEVDYPVSQAKHLGEGIKGVNWLTLLGDEWLERVGGRDRLREQLDASFIFHDYRGGLLIQAGPHPQLGDLKINNVPEHYRTLSRVLKPIRVDYPVALQHTHPKQATLDRERTAQWFARFDDL